MINEVVAFRIGSKIFNGVYVMWTGKYHIVSYYGRRVLVRDVWK